MKHLPTALVLLALVACPASAKGKRLTASETARATAETISSSSTGDATVFEPLDGCSVEVSNVRPATLVVDAALAVGPSGADVVISATITVDGIAQPDSRAMVRRDLERIPLYEVVKVDPGPHTVQIQWRALPIIVGDNAPPDLRARAYDRRIAVLVYE